MTRRYKAFRKSKIAIQHWFTHRLISKFNLKLIVVVGSVGKTSTKLAIASVLSGGKRTFAQEGNYNGSTTWCLPLFNAEPILYKKPITWFKLLYKMVKTLASRQFPYEILVMEWGIDRPGQMAEFSSFKPDVVVVTAISEEHMQMFSDLDHVATEELLACSYAKHSLINVSGVHKDHLKKVDNYKSYGTRNADYQLGQQPSDVGLNFNSTGWLDGVTITPQVIGDHMNLALVAGLAVADMLGFSGQEYLNGAENFKPYRGRMRVLNGLNGSMIVDDTYNSSPLAFEAGVRAIYELPYRKKIIVIGSMNELGDFSKEAHMRIAEAVIKEKTEQVVTIGKMATEWTAPLLKAKGIAVSSFSSPYAVGNYLRSLKLDPATLIYAKGSQDGVFAEESIRQVLADPADCNLLVRQNLKWQEIKNRQFQDYIPGQVPSVEV
jgi:UDP-N-acetylmuramoyl-tripeptide--D-alanyl-D-alanine ligase